MQNFYVKKCLTNKKKSVSSFTDNTDYNWY